MDRNHYRPAHIHIVVTHQGFSPLCTQVYPLDDPYLRDDAVFAVVDSLVREFKHRKGDPNAKLELEFDVKMAPGEEGKWNGVSMNGGGRIGAGAGMDGNWSNGAALERMG
jgi:protocatechuate 3,4-dioxygenase beta subunit